MPSLTHVGISRVRSLRGIMFEEPFDFNRLKTRSSAVTVMRAQDAIRRAQQEIAVPAENNSDEE